MNAGSCVGIGCIDETEHAAANLVDLVALVVDSVSVLGSEISLGCLGDRLKKLSAALSRRSTAVRLQPGVSTDEPRGSGPLN